MTKETVPLRPDETGRIADHAIEPLFLDRWSPRDFTGEAMPKAVLRSLFEAARWAPSSSNLQPWRFLYAERGTADWPLFFDPLMAGNKSWATNASVLITVLSKRTAPVRGSDDLRENYNHSFDAGAACMALALQATALGWAAHAMGGFDVGRAIVDLEIPENYRMECMIAIGRPSPEATTKRSGRAPQDDFVRAGRFVR